MYMSECSWSYASSHVARRDLCNHRTSPKPRWVKYSTHRVEARLRIPNCS